MKQFLGLLRDLEHDMKLAKNALSKTRTLLADKSLKRSVVFDRVLDLHKRTEDKRKFKSKDYPKKLTRAKSLYRNLDPSQKSKYKERLDALQNFYRRKC